MKKTRFGAEQDPDYVIESSTKNIFKEEDNEYGFFGIPPPTSERNIQTTHSQTEIQHLRAVVLEQLAEGYHQQKLQKKRAFFKWMIMAKNRQSLVVLERVLMASKPTVMKTLWMLKTEWVRRGSYRYQKGVKMLIKVFDRLKRRSVNTGFRSLEDIIRIKSIVKRTFVWLNSASENKKAFAFEKLLKYKRNWEAIKKMDLFFLMRDKLNAKKKIALKTLFCDTRIFLPLHLIMASHNGIIRAQFRNKRTFFSRFRDMASRTQAVKKFSQFFDNIRKDRLKGSLDQMLIQRLKRKTFVNRNGKKVRAPKMTRREERQEKALLIADSLDRVFKRKKREAFSSFKQGLFEKRKTLSGIQGLMKGKQNVEKQLAFDKTYLIGKCKEILRKMKNLNNRKNVDAIKNFFKQIKMTQSVKLQFIRRGLRICDSLFTKRKHQGFKSILHYIQKSEQVQTDTSKGFRKLFRLFHDNKKQKVLKAYYQLKTGTLVSQKTRFAGKLLCGALKALFNRRKARAFRTIQLQGYVIDEAKRQRKKGATNQIIVNLARSNMLLKAIVLKRLREMLEYQKNIFKNGKRVKVFNQMYGDRGPELDESERKLPLLLRKLVNNRLRQGMEGIATFSKLDFFTRMRGFRKEDEMQRRNQLSQNFIETINTFVLKKRLKHGNYLLTILKNETSVMKRVYRDQTEDNHDEVVQNTIKIANLIKHFRAKQIILLDEYFERWKEATWEYDDDFGYDDFEEEMVNGLPPRHPQFQIASGLPQMMVGRNLVGTSGFDPRNKGHVRDMSSPYRLGEQGLHATFDQADNYNRYIFFISVVFIFIYFNFVFIILL